MVGREMIKVLESFDFPAEELYPAASPRSLEKEVIFKGKAFRVMSVEEAVEKKPQIAIFSAGSSVSKQWAPVFAQAGTYVIDNSSAWRMEKSIPLVVPEVNGHLLTSNEQIIANPNSSTIQLVMVLSPLEKHFGLKRVVVATYQSVTGSGAKGMEQLMAERQNRDFRAVYPHPIDLNILPQAGDFDENGYTTEEMKLVNETAKILGKKIALTATAARVPVLGGHSEAVNVELERDFDLNRVRTLLSEMPGVVVEDNPARNRYPMPIEVRGYDEVFVGRIRRDFSVANGLNLWIVADNIRKGAATNAVQIAILLVKKNIIG